MTSSMADLFDFSLLSPAQTQQLDDQLFSSCLDPALFEDDSIWQNDPFALTTAFTEGNGLSDFLAQDLHRSDGASTIKLLAEPLESQHMASKRLPPLDLALDAPRMIKPEPISPDSLTPLDLDTFDFPSPPRASRSPTRREEARGRSRTPARGGTIRSARTPSRVGKTLRHTRSTPTIASVPRHKKSIQNLMRHVKEELVAPRSYETQFGHQTTSNDYDPFLGISSDPYQAAGSGYAPIINQVSEQPRYTEDYATDTHLPVGSPVSRSTSHQQPHSIPPLPNYGIMEPDLSSRMASVSLDGSVYDQAGPSRMDSMFQSSFGTDTFFLPGLQSPPPSNHVQHRSSFRTGYDLAPMPSPHSFDTSSHRARSPSSNISPRSVHPQVNFSRPRLAQQQRPHTSDGSSHDSRVPLLAEPPISARTRASRQPTRPYADKSRSTTPEDQAPAFTDDIANPRSRGRGVPGKQSRSRSRAGGSGGINGGGGFVNFTLDDSQTLLSGVAPSGNLKTKAKREQEAAERKRKISAAAHRAVRDGDLTALREVGIID